MKQSDLFPLTAAQLDGVRRDLKNAVIERNRIMLQKKAAADEFKAQLDIAEGAIKRLAFMLDDHDRSVGAPTYQDAYAAAVSAAEASGHSLGEQITAALVDPANVESLRPGPDSGIESVKLSSAAGEVTLHKDGRTESRRSNRPARSTQEATA